MVSCIRFKEICSLKNKKIAFFNLPKVCLDLLLGFLFALSYVMGGL
jgi:hypothetical protein